MSESKRPVRPDYVHCIDVAEKREDGRIKTWCDRFRPDNEWAFTSIDHAVKHAEGGGYMMICKECCDTISGIIKRGRFA